MAIYRCENCDEMIDGDWNVPTEHNGNEYCEACTEKYFDEDDNWIGDEQ